MEQMLVDHGLGLQTLVGTLEEQMQRMAKEQIFEQLVEVQVFRRQLVEERAFHT